MKLKDTHAIGIISGICGCLIMLPIEYFFMKKKWIKRSYRETAAGVYVNRHHEAKSRAGNLLGLMMEFGLCAILGVIKTKFLVKNGLKYLIPKGLMYGMTSGAVVVAMVGPFSNNRVKPQDAVTHICYLIKCGVFGMTAAFVISKISDKSLFKNSEVPSEDTSKLNSQI